MNIMNLENRSQKDVRAKLSSIEEWDLRRFIIVISQDTHAERSQFATDLYPWTSTGARV